jgi:hypothetical protein
MEYDEFHMVEMRGTVDPDTREWIKWMDQVDQDKKPRAKPTAKEKKKYIEEDDSDEDQKPAAKQTAAARKPTKKKTKKR